MASGAWTDLKLPRGCSRHTFWVLFRPPTLIFQAAPRGATVHSLAHPLRSFILTGVNR